MCRPRTSNWRACFRVSHAVTQGVPVSVDTVDPEVMREALAIGVDILNDVRALRAPGALDVAAADPSVGVCLMHMQGEPGTMQSEPHYDGGDVVGAVETFLAARRDAALAAGIARERIALDPGIGFGKTPAHKSRWPGSMRVVVLDESRLSGDGRLLAQVVARRADRTARSG